MNYLKVKELSYYADLLIDQCTEKKITNTTLTHALVRNKRILGSVIKEIEEAVSVELKNLELKAFKTGDELLKLKLEEEKDLPVENKTIPEDKKLQLQVQFSLGYESLTEEEKTRHKELANEYNEFMKQESDVQLYMIDFLKIENVELEYQYIELLENFIK